MASRRRFDRAVRVRAAGRLFVAAWGLALAGCAVRMDGPRGVVHTVGFVWTTTAKPEASPTEGAPTSGRVSFALGPTSDEEARLQRTRVAGLWADFTPMQRGVGLGWTDVLLVVPAENGVTRVDYDSSDWIATRLETGPAPR